MKKVMKKVVGFLTAALLVGGVGAGTLTAFATDIKTEVEKINTNDEFLIGSWRSYYDLSVASYETQTKELAEAGLNFSVSPLAYSKVGTFASTSAGTGTYLGNEADSYKRVNEIYSEYNMYYQVPYHYQGDVLADPDAFTHAKSYYIKDEPSAAEMQAVVGQMLDCQEKDSNRFAYVNLYPCYAGAANLGGSYYDHVSDYVNLIGAENLEYLSFDHYPFLKTESVRSTFFSDLETIRKVAYDNGRIKTGGCPLLSEHLGYRRLTPDEAKWGYNVLLTYGCKILTGYVWANHAYATTGEDYYSAVVNQDGTKTDLYEPLSILNWQTRQLGPTLMDIDVKHAYHTNQVPTGAERLPSSFIFQPADGDSDFVYSICYSKDDAEKYVMVFNKALSGDKKKYTINVDLSTGVESLTEIRPTDFSYDTLPDPKNPSSLGTPAQVQIDVSSGSFNTDMGPGDMKIFKLNGDVEIFEELAKPSSSHKSGTYVGQQQVSFITGDTGAELWYTTDGTYPVPYQGTAKRYTAPVTVGEDGVTGNYTVRAVAYRNGELSNCTTAELFIAEAAGNVAAGKRAVFTDYDGNALTAAGFNGSVSSASFITDNSYSPTGSCLSVQNADGENVLGWVTVDLEQPCELDKVYVSFWHDWKFTGVKIQVAVNADFSDAKTIFEGDLQNIPYGGVEFDVSELSAVRYIRATGNAKGEGFSIFTEIQAYNKYDAGVNLIADLDGWKALGGSEWINTGKAITLKGEYNRETWDRAYGYTAATYKNFILDCEFAFNISDASAWGFFGLGLYRDYDTDVQSNSDSGFYVGIEPKGRVLLWKGKEIGDLNANIAGWSMGATTRFRIVSVEDTVMVSVNNVPIMFEKNEALNLDAGYISLSTGLLPVTVSKLTVQPIEVGNYEFPEIEETVLSVQETKISVAQYTSLKDVKAALPNTITVLATDEKEYEISVAWESFDYDGVTNATFPFVGTLSAEDLKAHGLINANLVTANAGVYVRPELDFTELRELIAQAKTLQETDYTSESWMSFQAKLEAAEAILEDEYAEKVFTDIGTDQLRNFMKNLVSVVDKTALQTEVAEFDGFDYSPYTAYSAAKLQTALAEGQAVLLKTNASSADVHDARAELNRAKNALEWKMISSPKPVAPSQEPTKEASGCNSALNPMAGGMALLAVCVGKRKKRRLK